MEKTENFGSKALIGEGSYGRVYYATLNDGVTVALKKLDVSLGLRLVHIEEGQNRYLELSDGFLLPNVPVDIECSPCQEGIQRILVCTFRQMAAAFNEISGVKGNIPLGCFNAMFNYTGSWQVDASSTKSLAVGGYFNRLYEVKLAKLTLFLRNEIKRAVPSSWDPASLASFIKNYDTHIVTSVTIGGRDVVYIRQHQSSPLPVSEIDNYVNDMRKHRFQDAESQSIIGPLNFKDKDITVIFRRRGGDDLEQSHTRWAKTVPAAPDIINRIRTSHSNVNRHGNEIYSVNALNFHPVSSL
ncbi:hypothetical protein F2Q69_00052503 [Brassica cretica]|uniref:MACPF domain-containing protein n=1 Tax=Brassica cretica TaxID=69181 RepID=A0A8S9N0G0_BRACR|nr:hypothetical protein F2Q69_00052503 [Brassica cretica]